jgi:hypothetical protein
VCLGLLTLLQSSSTLFLLGGEHRLIANLCSICIKVSVAMDTRELSHHVARIGPRLLSQSVVGPIVTTRTEKRLRKVRQWRAAS